MLWTKKAKSKLYTSGLLSYYRAVLNNKSLLFRNFHFPVFIICAVTWWSCDKCLAPTKPVFISLLVARKGQPALGQKYGDWPGLEPLLELDLAGEVFMGLGLGIGMGLTLEMGPSEPEELDISVGDLKRLDLTVLLMVLLSMTLFSCVLIPDPFSMSAFSFGSFELGFSLWKMAFFDFLDIFTSLLAVLRESNASQSSFS